MINDSLVKFIDLNKKCCEKDILNNTIMFNAAPVVEGVRPSVLINFTSYNKDLYNIWNKYKKEYSEDNRFQFIELKMNHNNVSVLFYNEEILKETILKKANYIFLEKYGYSRNMNIKEQLSLLKNHYINQCPHEIGIYLGYPVDDVMSFIDNCGKNYLFFRYWKVYHNPLRAINIFYEYDMARKRAIDRLLSKNKELSCNNLKKI